MIRLPIGCVIAALACLAGVPASAQSPVVCYPGSGSVSQSPFCQPINPMAIGAAFTQSARAADLVATSSSSRVILGLSSTVTAQTARVCNTSATIAAYVALGDVTVTVTTANGLLVSAGGCVSLNIGSNTYLAGITGSSSATLVTSLGYGVAALGGGGGGAASGGGTPGGSDTQVQYNNAGSFGGISSWTTNGTTNFIGATNSVLSAGSAGGTAAILGGTTTAIATYSAGTATPRIQSQGLTASNAGGAFSMWANSTGGPAIWMTSSRGTTVGDYTIAQAGDSMGSIIWEAADGTDFARAAQIVGRVTGTPGANVMPGQIEFLTSPVGTSTPVLALTLNSDQTALFAGAATAPAFIPSGSTVPTNGMYLPSANNIAFAVSSTRIAIISSVGISANNTSGAQIAAGAASSTVPTLIPNRADTTTGIGAQASGNISIIAAGTEQVRITSTAAIFNSQMTAGGSGTASNASLLLSGTLFTGGTATTTFPQMLFQPTGTTAVTTWSASGTIFGANAVSGFAGSFLDFHVAGAASVWNVTSNGTTNARVYNASTSGSAYAVNSDVFWTRAGAASWQSGASDAATATAQTTRVQSVVAGTSNTAGANWTLVGSLSTGSSASGDIIFQTGATGAGATVQNTATTALTIKGASGQVQVTSLSGTSFSVVGTNATAHVNSIQNNAANGFSTVSVNDNGSVQKAAFGYANASAAVFATQAFFQGVNVPVAISTAGAGTVNLLFPTAGGASLHPSVAIPAGGSQNLAYKATSTANFGVFFGSGAPSLSAAKGSLYLRSDGTGINDRAYINTDGATTWTNLVTAL